MRDDVSKKVASVPKVRITSVLHNHSILHDQSHRSPKSHGSVTQ